MPNRSKDWLDQAERDLERCRIDIEHGFYEWACFTAQQSAEKAVKALAHHLRGIPWGHSLVFILKQMKERVEITEAIMEDAQLLDAYYILARYPNGWPAGAPKDYFGKKKAEEANEAARRIFAFCRDKISQ